MKMAKLSKFGKKPTKAVEDSVSLKRKREDEENNTPSKIQKKSLENEPLVQLSEDEVETIIMLQEEVQEEVQVVQEVQVEQEVQVVQEEVQVEQVEQVVQVEQVERKVIQVIVEEEEVKDDKDSYAIEAFEEWKKRKEAQKQFQLEKDKVAENVRKRRACLKVSLPQ